MDTGKTKNESIKKLNIQYEHSNMFQYTPNKNLVGVEICPVLVLVTIIQHVYVSILSYIELAENYR